MNLQEERMEADNGGNSPFCWLSLFASFGGDSASDVSSLTTEGQSHDGSTISALLVEPLLLLMNEPLGTHQAPRHTGCTSTDMLPVVRDVRLVLDASGRRVRRRRRWGVVFVAVMTVAVVVLLLLFTSYHSPTEDALPDMEDDDLFLQRQHKIITFLQLITLDEEKTIRAEDPILQEILQNTTFTLPNDANDLIAYYALAAVRQVADIAAQETGTFLAARARNSAALPPDIGLLTQLEHLQLRGFSGTVPSELGRLTHLEVVDLAYNTEWTGTIPSAWEAWTSAEVIWLTGLSGVTGSVPEVWCNRERLRVLEISHTDLVFPPVCAERFAVESSDRPTMDHLSLSMSVSIDEQR